MGRGANEGDGEPARPEVALPGAAVLAAVLVLVASLGLASAASALTQRGHVFSEASSFGRKGTGAEELEKPGGVAFSEKTGDIYVADTANNRVQVFKPGESKAIKSISVPYPLYVAVDDSTAGSDPSRGDIYVVGETKEEAKELEPGEAPEDFVVYKFDPVGLQIAVLKKVKFKVKVKEEGEVETEEFEAEFEALKGVAVGPSGSLYLDQEEEIFKLNNADKNKGVAIMESESGEVEPGLAANAEGNVFVGLEEVGTIAEEHGTTIEQVETEINAELDAEEGISPEGIFDRVAEGTEVKEGTETKLEVARPEFDAEYTSAIAVNPVDESSTEVDERDDVYLLNITSKDNSASTTVAQFDPKGELIQRFGAPGLKQGEGVAVDPKTGTVYVSDTEEDKVDVFPLEPVAEPAVSDLSACVGGGAECPHATTLQAQLNPEGASTKYHFEYGAGPCPEDCSSLPPGETSASFGGVAVSTELPSLPAGSYRFRLKAENEKGFVESAEETFAVIATSPALPDGREWELVTPPEKDGAEPESVPEVGATIRAAEDGQAITYVSDGPVGSKIEGSRSPERDQELSVREPSRWSTIDITTPNDRGAGLASGPPSEYQDFSSNLALALVSPFPGAAHAEPFAEPSLSPPLGAGEQKRAAEGKPYQELSLYLRDDEPLPPEGSQAEKELYESAAENGRAMNNPGYLALVTELNAPGHEPFGGGFYEYREGVEYAFAATPDLSHVVYYANDRAETGGVKPGPASAMYEWNAGSSPEEEAKKVSVLPDGTVFKSSEATIGGSNGHIVRNAISSDGSRIFWSSTPGAPGGEHLYMRDTATGSEATVQLDAPGKAATGAGAVEPVFQGASTDGSKAFFTDQQQLTADSKAHGGRADLYVFEPEAHAEPEPPECEDITGGRLCDLTPAGENGESADVDVHGPGGGVLGASEDGSYVYFVAGAALAPGASHSYCEPEEEEEGEVRAPEGSSCNLYVRHYNGREWEPTRFIASLSEEDAPTWGVTGVNPKSLAYLSSRVAPNGQYLAFMSDRQLTHYDNVEGSHADEEVFLYDAGSQTLTCASCKSDGLPPEHESVLDNYFRPEEGEPDEGIGLLVDRLGVWSEAADPAADHWLGGSIPGWSEAGDSVAPYQSRYLSSEGRLFFDSPADLVEAAKGPKEKVYEYEPAGVGSCASSGGCVGLISSPEPTHESAFLDASANGDDVFFISDEHLVPEDKDEFFDVYDARICGTDCLVPPPPPTPRCESVGGCRPGTYGESSYQTPASAAVGTGNVGKIETLGYEEHKPKPLTLAQKFEKALKACKADRKKSKRKACEKAARAKYEPMIRAQKLASAMKACARDSRKSKRHACEAAARKAYGQAAKKSSVRRAGR